MASCRPCATSASASPAGETLGLVGESGSGKTTLALGAIGYLPANGRVRGGASQLGDIDLLGRSRNRELRRCGARGSDW